MVENRFKIINRGCSFDIRVQGAVVLALFALHNSIREYAASDLAVRNPFPSDKSITLGRLPEESHLQPTEEKNLDKDQEGLTL